MIRPKQVEQGRTSSCITLPENDNCPTKVTLRGICTKVQEGTSLGI